MQRANGKQKRTKENSPKEEEAKREKEEEEEEAEAEAEAEEEAKAEAEEKAGDETRTKELLPQLMKKEMTTNCRGNECVCV